MSIIDWIIIGIAVLFALSGFFRGFRKIFFGKITKILAIVGGVFLAPQVSALLGDITFVKDKILTILPPLGNYILLAISAVLVMIAIMLFFLIVGKILKSLGGKDGDGKGIVDRIFGLLFGVVNAAILIMGGLIIVSILANYIGAIDTWLNETLLLADDSHKSLGKYCYTFALQVFEFIKGLFPQGEAEELINLLV
ncbi:CvpA family protein [Acholeplasma sp. OttesenSCG-928-E16]|nr:CvpA family protein [Acholeplasma sp. OttesenSCG-928-E16]